MYCKGSLGMVLFSDIIGYNNKKNNQVINFRRQASLQYVRTVESGNDDKIRVL